MVHEEIKCEMEGIENNFSTVKFTSVTPEESLLPAPPCQWPRGMDLSLARDEGLSLNEGKGLGRKVKLRPNRNHFKLSEYTSDVGP